MKIAIFGTGYVGLVSGACFAEVGNDVICVDVDAEKISNLQKGLVPIYEPGLEALVVKNTREGRLSFTTDPAVALNQTKICFIAVGTPPKEDGSADLKHVLEVAQVIATHATAPLAVGTKSTVPVGTGDEIEAVMAKAGRGPHTVFSNPEFLKEGDAVSDFLKPDRVILGLGDPNAAVMPLLRELYAPFTRQKDRLILMNRRSAELTKYAANAMLATRISFINEMANLCEKVGANINDVRLGIGSDPRIGSAFLFPGMGFGGSCFPKDVQAILRTAKAFQVPLQVVEAVNQANESQKEMMPAKIKAHFQGKISGVKLALWGLSFKARTDDIRQSPALKLIDILLANGAKLTVFDPQAMAAVQVLYGDKLQYAPDAYSCLDGAEGLIIATEWNEFRSPDYEKIKAQMAGNVVFDGRNILNRGRLAQLGFTSYGVGLK